jgi:hypothetical protein
MAIIGVVFVVVGFISGSSLLINNLTGMCSLSTNTTIMNIAFNHTLVSNAAQVQPLVNYYSCLERVAQYEPLIYGLSGFLTVAGVVLLFLAVERRASRGKAKASGKDQSNA